MIYGERALFLTARDVWKSYPAAGMNSSGGKKRAVLKGINFSLARGEITGLLGESGSGKSTLARVLLGLERPDSGEILIEGMPAEQWRKSRPGKISAVFQDYATSINPAFSVSEAIAEGFMSDHSERPGREAILELMGRVGLASELFDALPGELSGGQAQRVCLARAAAARPGFIVYDEAVSALDAPAQAQVAELLKKMRGGATCLFIAHDVQIAALLCPKILVLHQGKITDNFIAGEAGQAVSPYLRGLLASTIIFKSTFK